MGKRFVFKDTAGTLCGYLFQGDKEIHCCVPLLKPAEFVLLSGEEQVARYELDAGGREYLFPLQSARITGGYIADEGRLLFSTDDDASRAWRQRMMSMPPVKSRDKSVTQESVPEAETSQREKEKNGHPDGITDGSMQRRWPPPPCMPGAYYERGEWKYRSGNRVVHER